ncbi:immunity 49 family protein [Kribbella sp. NBC_01505]|uniref:Imm49 family immunity protein n=1 Tax=Kribbella sp. NBC_01505 TaxID=2903580 RepID=UPI00386F79ED
MGLEWNPRLGAAAAECVAGFRPVFGEFVARAGSGGPLRIKAAAEKLLDYVSARSITVDRRFEQRETWIALRTAAELAVRYLDACWTPAGDVVDCWVEYLGVGFGIEQHNDEELRLEDWTKAFELAVILRDNELMLRLVEFTDSFPVDDLTAEIRGYLAITSGEPLDADAPPLLRAIAEHDGEQFGQELAQMLRQRPVATPDTLRDLLPWSALAMSSYAFKADLSIESGALPRRLVEGTGYRSGYGDR